MGQRRIRPPDLTGFLRRQRGDRPDRFGAKADLARAIAHKHSAAIEPDFTGVRPRAMTDTLVVNTHNAALTHPGSVAHLPVEERVCPA
ncbi:MULTISPECIES: hypothetical protein [Amycolatopsis]|uniref:hypothetical protein n=1 Tax=Amycolatopsis TaxID=1813 RepID=UPI0007DF2552|nr:MULTISPECIES: hypothetical protein [Amycolatopsis]OAP21867.1 hypothetical protein A4R44_07325 [Amycolatopsis sp. M39]